jgi:hypothetical protein
MIPCDHGSDPKTCRLPTMMDASVKCCEKFAATMDKVAANLGAPVSIAPIVTNSVPIPAAPVQVMNKPEVTDPAAQNAMELAALLNEVAALKRSVEILRKTLADEEKRLADAELLCTAKMKSLVESVGHEKEKEEVTCMPRYRAEVPVIE